MWIFEQLTGRFRDSTGEVVGIGYAGKGPGKNNPDMQNVHDVGPLPVGLYTIEPPADDIHVGKYAMRLDPSPTNEMFGRAGFFIHGDNAAHIGQASDGCIILSRDIRELIGKSLDKELQVVREFPTLLST